MRLTATGLALLLLTACSRHAPEQLNERLLDNLEYLSAEAGGGRVRLVAGKYQDNKNNLTVERAPSRIVYGDVTGDGQPDALVPLRTLTGASSTLNHLALVTVHDGKPVNVSSLPLGDRIGLQSVTITRGEINVEMIVHAPDDPQCCPTLRVIRHYRYANEGFKEVTP